MQALLIRDQRKIWNNYRKEKETNFSFFDEDWVLSIQKYVKKKQRKL